MRKRNILYNIVLILLVVACIICCIISFQGFKELHYVKNNYEMIAEDAYRDTEDSIDFDKLKKINPDIIAWIRIPDTPIDYPVVMAQGNNDYYLNHDVKGNYSQYGSIFTDYRLYGSPFTLTNCIIYGHNMGRWTNVMFSSLMNYEKQSYYNKHKDVYIYTEEAGKTEYRIVSVREVNYSDYAYKITYESKNTFREWIKRNISDSMIECDTESMMGCKKAVTLSTCTYGTNKLILVCVPKE